MDFIGDQIGSTEPPLGRKRVPKALSRKELTSPPKKFSPSPARRLNSLFMSSGSSNRKKNKNLSLSKNAFISNESNHYDVQRCSTNNLSPDSRCLLQYLEEAEFQENGFSTAGNKFRPSKLSTSFETSSPRSSSTAKLQSVNSTSPTWNEKACSPVLSPDIWNSSLNHSGIHSNSSIDYKSKVSSTEGCGKEEYIRHGKRLFITAESAAKRYDSESEEEADFRPRTQRLMHKFDGASSESEVAPVQSLKDRFHALRSKYQHLLSATSPDNNTNDTSHGARSSPSPTPLTRDGLNMNEMSRQSIRNQLLSYLASEDGEAAEEKVETTLIEEKTSNIDETHGFEMEDESEKLARQLMMEEQASLIQRLQEQQNEMIAQMRNLDGEATALEEATNIAGEIDQDLMMAMRLAAEDEADDEQVDPDTMTYDELLELSDRIGDVGRDIWRQHSQSIVDNLRTLSYNEYMDLSNGFDDQICLVCQYAFKQEEQLKLLPCRHCFHSECIDGWLIDNKTCVTCKQSIVEEATS